MKVEGSLSDRKLELAQVLLALDDELLLSQLEDFMQVLISSANVQDEIPQSHLDSIAKGDADSAAGRVVKLADFRAKYARYGV